MTASGSATGGPARGRPGGTRAGEAARARRTRAGAPGRPRGGAAHGGVGTCSWCGHAVYVWLCGCATCVGCGAEREDHGHDD